MKNERIYKTAEALKKVLEPYCTRIEIAGSVRRQKEAPKDIEIVCIANTYRLHKFLIDMKRQGWIFMKDGPLYKRFLYEPYWVDLFICKEDNWGAIYLIRTGPKDFNIKIIDKAKKQGMTFKDGYLRNGAGRIKTLEEKDIFTNLGIEFIAPEKRY